MLIKLDLKPGINRDNTSYSNVMSWYDCNRIRFKNGRPEVIGGWQRYTTQAFTGNARSLFRFTDNTGVLYTGIGTTCKFFMEAGGTLTDVTPIRATLSGAVNPLSTTIGSDLVNVLDTAHLASAGDIIIMSGAVAIGGVPAGDLNKEHTVYDVVDADNYRIQVATTATSTVSGAGGTIDVNYLYYCGTDETVIGSGWGTGSWGSGTWGTSSGSVATASTRIWYQDNFGEDLVLCPRDGPLFYWDATNPSNRAINFTALAGASNVPTVASSVLVSQSSRHVIAFGCNPLGSATQSKLLVRWSDQEDAADWTPTTTNQSGDFTLNRGSRIVQVVQTKSDILIFTDKALYSMQYIGGVLVFSFNVIADNINLAGAQCACAVGDDVYWMSKGHFHLYNGRIQHVPCPVENYIHHGIDMTRGDKIYAASNSNEHEVIWFYQSMDSSSEVDKYVTFNHMENAWYFGSMARTAWVEDIASSNPIAASPDGYLYSHEVGHADLSTGSPVDLGSYIESSEIEIGSGDVFAFVDRFIPDINFDDSTASYPSVTVILKAKNFPGDAAFGSTSDSIASLTIDPTTHTSYKNVSLRGRSIVARIASGTAGTRWALGTIRIDAREDGRQ